MKPIHEIERAAAAAGNFCWRTSAIRRRPASNDRLALWLMASAAEKRIRLLWKFDQREEFQAGGSRGSPLGGLVSRIDVGTVAVGIYPAAQTSHGSLSWSDE
jgi:hypothetical protein